MRMGCIFFLFWEMYQTVQIRCWRCVSLHVLNSTVTVDVGPLFSFVLSLFSMVRASVRVGSLCLFFYVWFLFRPSMVLDQRQVSLVVSDWESYLGSLGFTVGLWGFVSVWVFVATRYCFIFFCRFHVIVYCFCSSVHLSLSKTLWTLTTLHLGPILTPLQTKRRSAVTSVPVLLL